jgi:hypothetical protein
MELAACLFQLLKSPGIPPGPEITRGKFLILFLTLFSHFLKPLTQLG